MVMSVVTQVWWSCFVTSPSSLEVPSVRVLLPRSRLSWWCQQVTQMWYHHPLQSSYWRTVPQCFAQSTWWWLYVTCEYCCVGHSKLWKIWHKWQDVKLNYNFLILMFPMHQDKEAHFEDSNKVKLFSNRLVKLCCSDTNLKTSNNLGKIDAKTHNNFCTGMGPHWNLVLDFSGGYILKSTI